MNLCRTCNEDSGSVSAFDAHWVGREKRGDRCMDIPEMETKGFQRSTVIEDPKKFRQRSF